SKKAKATHSRTLDNGTRSDHTGVVRTRGVQQRNGAQGVVPDIGIVECVELVDFMCHEHVKVNLCPKVNFITGQNGSGKSAILTALIIALGGKATLTNRASNLKGFIREGQGKATVRVQLRNCGPEAYHPELFGASILVERVLSSSDSGSASQFKIKNGESGAVVSRKKEDLVAIIDHMAIQIDNPINILSQDAAREFLASTSPDKMYHFFLKGTQLMQLSDDLEAVCKAITRAQASIDRKKEVLPEMKAERQRWKQHYDDMKQARNLSEQVTDLSKQMAWAIVEEAEKEASGIEEALQVHQRKIEKIDEKVAEESARMEEIQSKSKELAEKADRELAQLEPLQAERSVPYHELSEINAALREFKQTEDEMNSVARSTRQRRDAIAKELEAERARLQGDNKTGRIAIQKQVGTKEEQIKAEEAKVMQLQEKQLEYENKSAGLRESKSARYREVDKHTVAVTKCRNALDSLEKQTTNHMNAFGRGVPEVLDLVDRAQWRGMKPVGPLGKFLKVRDSKWSRVIESLLDKVLNAFLVESHADRQTLDAIMRRCGCQSRIIICNTELFDYSHGEPDQRFTTVLRALDVSNEVVKRQLINLNRIEQVILVEQRAMGDKIMQSNKGGFPRNVIACLTAEGYSVGTRSGGLSTQAMRMVPQSGRLGEDVARMIEREKQQLAQHNGELNKAQRALQQVEREQEGLKTKHMDGNNAIRLARSHVNKLQAEIQQLRDQLLSDEPAKISALETEHGHLTQQLESIKSQFRDLFAQQQAKKEEMEQVESNIALVDAKIARTREHAAQLRQEADDMASERQKHINNTDYWNAKRVSLQEKAAALERQHADAEAVVQEQQVQARRVSEERVRVKHPAATLDRMVSECKARLDEIEKSSRMSLDQVAEKADLHITAYAKAKEEVRSIGKLVAVLKTAHQQRLQKWIQFRDSMTVRTKMQFTQHLYQRGYMGKLEFDHANRTLVPKVQTDQDLVSGHNSRNSQPQNGEGFQRKDTKSLSGGEKSFTTICLLLSLWEAMSCPVRALDEFDVFMDAANRAIAMRMMVDSAKSSSTTQFILITPQDMNVKPDADVAIFRLSQPRRAPAAR
ncbi:Structural maintenance of chromosomes protein 6, partial [Linderina pennispora]